MCSSDQRPNRRRVLRLRAPMTAITNKGTFSASSRQGPARQMERLTPIPTRAPCAMIRASPLATEAQRARSALPCLHAAARTFSGNDTETPINVPSKRWLPAEQHATNSFIAGEGAAVAHRPIRAPRKRRPRPVHDCAKPLIIATVSAMRRSRHVYDPFHDRAGLPGVASSMMVKP